MTQKSAAGLDGFYNAEANTSVLSTYDGGDGVLRMTLNDVFNPPAQPLWLYADEQLVDELIEHLMRWRIKNKARKTSEEGKDV